MISLFESPMARMSEETARDMSGAGMAYWTRPISNMGAKLELALGYWTPSSLTVSMSEWSS